MKVDIISDAICPWCYIGKVRFEKALAQRPDLQVEAMWRPFQLNPDMPDEGMDRMAYLEAKFGGPDGAREVYDRIQQAAESDGLDLKFDAIPRTPNTVDAHRIVRWAASASVQDAVVTLLFQRYFEQGADLSDRGMLADTAAEAGMDRDLVAQLLDEGADVELVRQEDAMARQMGIHGVPAFIFEGKYLVSGAQDPEVFVQVLDRVDAELRAGGIEPTAEGD